jgi:hypothetical protein
MSALTRNLRLIFLVFNIKITNLVGMTIPNSGKSLTMKLASRSNRCTGLLPPTLISRENLKPN